MMPDDLPKHVGLYSPKWDQNCLDVRNKNKQSLVINFQQQSREYRGLSDGLRQTKICVPQKREAELSFRLIDTSLVLVALSP